MFTGVYEFNVDNKGRISIPAKFREFLANAGINHLVVTRGLDNCLFVFTPERWAELQEKIQTLPLGKKEARFLMRFLLGSATECPLNEQGRINIPSSLLKAALIEKEVVIMGVGNRLEIWDKLKWKEYEQENSLHLEELGGLGI